jgi:hypothetical protein
MFDYPWMSTYGQGRIYLCKRVIKDLVKKEFNQFSYFVT